MEIVARTGVGAILCEKPLAKLHPAALTMSEICRKARIPLLVGHQRRYESRHKAVRKAIQSKVLGPVRKAAAWFTGDWLNNGTHAVDTLRFLVGDGIPMEFTPSTDGPPCFKCSVFCEDGHVSIDSYGNLAPGYMKAMYDDLIECIETEKQPICSGHDGAEAVRIALQQEEQWNARSTADIA